MVDLSSRVVAPIIITPGRKERSAKTMKVRVIFRGAKAEMPGGWEVTARMKYEVCLVPAPRFEDAIKWRLGGAAKLFEAAGENNFTNR